MDSEIRAPPSEEQDQENSAWQSPQMWDITCPQEA